MRMPLTAIGLDILSQATHKAVWRGCCHQLHQVRQVEDLGAVHAPHLRSTEPWEAVQRYSAVGKAA